MEMQTLSTTQRAGASAVIEVVSDIVCPWCFIGKRRLEKALALLDRRNVEVRWRAFQLNPGTAKAGMDRREYRLRKFGSAAYAQQLEARVVAAGAEDGIDFQFDRIERIPNTFDAHRLAWLAGNEGAQDAVVESLFRAYFIDSEDVGNSEVLRKIGVENGLSPDKVDELLASDLGATEVVAEETYARLSGVNGVPTFFIDGAPITSGAQKPHLLASILRPALDPAAAQCSIEDGRCS